MTQNKICYGIITDIERKERYEGIFKNNKVPLKSSKKKTGVFPDGIHKYYEVDINLISNKELEQIVIHMAKAFHLNPKGVRKLVKMWGYYPLRADGVTIHNSGKVME